jgi:hypothetical protein
MSWTSLIVWLSLYPLQRRGLLRVSKRSEALGTVHRAFKGEQLMYGFACRH